MHTGSRIVIEVLCSAAVGLLLVGSPSCGGGGGGNPPAQNQAPTANFTVSQPPGGAPVLVKFFNQSSDADGTIVNFDWDFDGDGTVDQSGSTPDGQFVYSLPGTFQVALRVTDDDGASAAVSNAVVIQDAAFGSAVIDPVETEEPTSLSGLEVAGNPAVFATSQGKLLYYRATDTAGNSWEAPVVAAAQTASFTSPAIIGGNPAVLFHSSGNANYVRATDALGTAWGEVEFLNLASFEADAPVALLEVAGRPAALFEVVVAGNDNRVFYLRSEDALGATWDPAQTVNATPDSPAIQDIDGLLVNGRPAYVCTSTAGELLYMRADDDLGASWPATAVVVAPALPTTRPSAAIIAGKPAIAVAGIDTLFFLQASDADGNAWGLPQTVVLGSTALADASLANVGGRTVIAFRTVATGALDIVTAADADGNDFQSRDTLEGSGVTGLAVPLLGGTPAVVYNLTGGGLRLGAAQ